ncbi:MAG TPA: polymer-forming cytoskeletal protein [Stellaceae bacterium]
MAIFSRTKKPGDDGDNSVLDQDSELDLPVKPASRPSGGGAVPTRIAAVPPVGPSEKTSEPRSANARTAAEIKAMEGKAVADMTRPSDMARKLVEAPPPAKVEPELRRLTVGREISLQGDITHCDQLVVEGSVTANVTCQEVAIMESGVLKGVVEIGHVEVRGLFEGTLNVTGRLLIRSTGRVVGKVHYGQIEIEIGGQISGEIESQPTAKGAAKNGAAVAPAGIL